MHQTCLHFALSRLSTVVYSVYSEYFFNDANCTLWVMHQFSNRFAGLELLSHSKQNTSKAPWLNSCKSRQMRFAKIVRQTTYVRMIQKVEMEMATNGLHCLWLLHGTSWPFMRPFSSSVRQYSSRTPRPCAQWAVQSCAPLQQGPSGGEITWFSVAKDLENGKFLWLCSTLAHMVGSQSLVSPTNYPSSRKSNLLSCCTWCTAFARLAWPTSTINLGKHCTCPPQTIYLTFNWNASNFWKTGTAVASATRAVNIFFIPPLHWCDGGLACPNFTCRLGIHLRGLKCRKPALQHSVEKWSSHHWLSSAIAFISTIVISYI